MDQMTEYLARAVIAARLAAAEEQRAGHAIRTARRAERRRRWRSAVAALWPRPARRAADSGRPALSAAATVSTVPPSVEVARLLEAAAHRVAEGGTGAEPVVLLAMAQVAAPTAPGAASALVDEAGTEASRLRAFGLVHAHVVETLGSREHALLLDLVEGRHDEVVRGRVA